MWTLQALTLLSVATIWFTCSGAEGQAIDLVLKPSYFNKGLCKVCKTQAECDADPGFCLWGETRDFCRHRICAKGPGQKCGGKFNLAGICANGLFCMPHGVNKCYGCHMETNICFFKFGFSILKDGEFEAPPNADIF